MFMLQLYFIAGAVMCVVVAVLNAVCYLFGLDRDMREFRWYFVPMTWLLWPIPFFLICKALVEFVHGWLVLRAAQRAMLRRLTGR